MIVAAMKLELRSLLRSPFRLLVLLIVLGAGVFVIQEGERDVQRWNDAVAAGQAKQQEALAEAEQWFESGILGPEDRPWIKLDSPRWQDWFAATRMSRSPAPLAGIAFASAEAGAVSVRINRFADPMLAAGMKIENPALAAAGGLDLVGVIALLLPLLILALGVEVGGFERYSGLLPLVRVQSGKDYAWLWARCVAVGLIAAVTGLALVLIAALSSGAAGAHTLAFGSLVLLYVAVWTALLGLVATISKHPSHGAVSLGAAWILLCFLVPAIGVERSAALASSDFALDLTVDARDSGQHHQTIDDHALFAQVFDRFPSLEEHAPDDRSRGRREAGDAMRILQLEERMAGRSMLAADHHRLVNLVSMASPTVALTRALEGLAGRSPAGAEAFRQAVVDAAALRAERYIRTTWSGAILDQADFMELHEATPQFIESATPSWNRELLILLGWAAGLTVLAVALARR